MKTVKERINEFALYHKTGDGECNGVLLKAYADEKGMSAADRFDLAYFYSLAYCIPSAVLLLRARDEIRKDPQGWAKAHEKELLFQSDRRYVKCNGAFQKMLTDYVRNIRRKDFEKQALTGNKLDFDKAFEAVGKWYFYGRFGCFLFIETLERLNGYETSLGSIDWSEGDTATSGLMNLFGMDKSADYFDKTGKLPEGATQEKLDKMLKTALTAIKRVGGATTIAEVETSLCAYRKFYKGTRYNGFYLDRQLEEIQHFKMQSGAANIVKDLIILRRKLFDDKYLGEVGGWKGVRKECKTLYQRTGKIM